MTSLEIATQIYNASLVTKNNENGDADQGVNNVLKNLKDVSKEKNSSNLKKDKALKREQLVAGLAFLRGHDLSDERKKELKPLKVDMLREKIVEQWEEMKPQDCDNCGHIYSYLPEQNIIYRCSICPKGMCPDCCTSDKLKTYEESQVKKLLHLICTSCVQQCNKRKN